MPDLRGSVEEQLAARLAVYGLELRGWFAIEAADIPAGTDGVAPGMAALLIGNHGRAMWDACSHQAEFHDGLANPMDRWTRRVILAALAELPNPAKALFPFGADLWPFQRFARRAMGLKPSPLGLLIHPQYGLWHALRAAIVFKDVELNGAPVHKVIHACDECTEKPCLSACPVNAFTDFGFAVAACRSWLDGMQSSQTDSRNSNCMADGCAARNACPVGSHWRYDEAQLRFHMTAFRG